MAQTALWRSADRGSRRLNQAEARALLSVGGPWRLRAANAGKLIPRSDGGYLLSVNSGLPGAPMP